MNDANNQIQLPVIHLNGTGRDTLTEEYMIALDAVRAAFSAMAKVTVNARDYYPAGQEAFTAAESQHVAQLQKLQEIQDHVTRILCHLTTIS